MIPRSRILSLGSSLIVPVILMLSVGGCGSGQEAQMEMLSGENARLRYESDSLMSLNRRMMQQIDALAMENRSLTARSADLEVQLREMKAVPAPEPPTVDPGAGYAAALAQYMDRDFSGAMMKFEGLLKQGIRQDLVDNCHYWIGECLYGMGKYRDAIGSFETALSMPHSEKQDESTLMIANSYALLGDKAAAREWYNKLITNFPASPYLQKAKEKVSRL